MHDDPRMRVGAVASAAASDLALPIVLVMVRGARDRARIADALRGRAVLRATATQGELRDALRVGAGELGAVIVEPVDAAGHPTSALVAEIVRARPQVPVVAYCEAGVEHSREIRALAVAGAHELVFRGVDDTGAALREALRSAALGCAGEHVLGTLLPLLPAALAPFASFCVHYPQRATSVAAIADALGLNRKTLVNQCARADLPAPAELMTWCRLLLVGYLLGTTQRTVESIGGELEFPSGTALRNTLKRYTGLRASDIRERGGLPSVRDALVRALREHRAGGTRRTAG